jgi:hypothetical protein
LQAARRALERAYRVQELEEAQHAEGMVFATAN